MRKKFGLRYIVGLTVVAAAAVFAVVGVNFAQANTGSIPLHNATAIVGTDCPDTTNAYWHFVFAPNNGNWTFGDITLSIGGTTFTFTAPSGTPNPATNWIPNGTQTDNVFVQVPAGYTLTDLQTDGSSAIWNDTTAPTQFNLSHVCTGTTTPPSADLTVTKSATPSFTRTHNWTIDKSANKDTVYSAGGGVSGKVTYKVSVTKDANGYTDSAWAVSGTIAVLNPNSFDVAGVNVSDATPGGNCTVTGGSNATVTALSTANFDYTCTFTSNPGSGTNTATATWDQPTYGTPTGSATGTHDYTFGDPTTVVNDAIDVTDTNGGSWHFTDSGSVSYDQTFTDPAGTCTSHENTATITQTGDSDVVTVQDCQGADLTVSKTATASFNRDYDWSVLKKQTTSATPINSSASSVNVNYQVQATWSGPVDSNWKVKGKITITNPNDWEAITTSGVTDAIDNGGVCTLDNPSQATVTVPASGSVDVPYTCTYSTAPSPSKGTNTGTATWDSGTYFTPDGSANGQATVDFSTVTPTAVTHDTTTVTDTWTATNTATTLGVAKVDGSFVKDAGNTLASFVSSYDGGTKTFTFTYSRSVTVVPNTCTRYNNTATVSDDATSGDNSSSAYVVVCGPVTGGLTIGFWSNKNGAKVLCAHDTAWRTLLNAANLRNANGTSYTVPSTGTCANADSNFATWLLNANAVNMSYMLSAQLAATILNVNYNGMNGTICVAGIDGNPITINQLIANAITFLATNGNTTASGSARNTATLYKNIFDTLNNGNGFAVPCV